MPACSLAPHGNVTVYPHALGDVTSVSECQSYCAATAACHFFSYIAHGANERPWRDLGGTCWLKSARGGDSGDGVDQHDGSSVYDEAFVWGAKPTPLATHVPGGSLLLDGPALSTRGWARGPTSFGVLPYMMRRRRGGEPQGPVRLVASYAFASAAVCCTPQADGEGAGECAAATACNETSEAAPSHLGVRELSFTKDGWLELRHRGDAATGQVEPSPHARRQSMSRSRLPRGNAHSFGRPSHTLDSATIAACTHPLPRLFQHSPACARAELAAIGTWDPSGGIKTDEEQSDSAYGLSGPNDGLWPDADEPGGRDDAGQPDVWLWEASQSYVVAPTVSDRMWPLHMAPLPPRCTDSSPHTVATRGAELGMAPPPADCPLAAAAGHCAQPIIRDACKVSCGACPAAVNVSCGCEPPPAEAAVVEGVPSAQTTAIIEGRRNASVALKLARATLAPLSACDVPQPAYVSFIDPPAADLAGGAPITVHGSGFAAPATCHFGEAVDAVVASAVSAHSLVCVYPGEAAAESRARRLPRVRLLSVQVSSASGSARWPATRGANWTGPGQLTAFNASRVLSVVDVQPMGGPTTGGTMLTLHGPAVSSFAGAAAFGQRHLRCHFGREGSEATRSGVTIGSVNATPALLARVNATSGSVEGHLANGTTSSHESWSSAASVVDLYAVRCLSPAGLPAGVLRLGLRYAHMPNEAASATLRMFSERPAQEAEEPANASAAPVQQLQMRAIYPYGGPSLGGTPVTLHADGLVDLGGTDRNGMAVQGLFCRFEPPREPQSSVAAAQATLRALAEANELVERLHAQLFAANASIAARVDPPADRTELERRSRLSRELHAARRQAAAANVAVVQLDAFGVDASRGSERIMSMAAVVPAILSPSGDRVECVSPPLEAEHATDRVIESSMVRLTLNADATAFSSMGLPFAYYYARAVRLSTAEPLGGPTDGNTTVTVHLRPDTLPRFADDTWMIAEEQGLPAGQPMGNATAFIEAASSLNTTGVVNTSVPRGQVADGVRCHFGSAVVPGRRLDAANASGAFGVAVSCRSPAVGAFLGEARPMSRERAAEVSLSVSLNGRDIVGGHRIRWIYYPTPQLSSLSPAGGPLAGGTLVRVRGRGLIHGVGRPRCRFATEAVPATKHSLDEMRCISPPLAAPSALDGGWREADVCVALNGDMDACAGGAGSHRAAGTFGYFDPLIAGVPTHIYPRAGPVHGGTAVSVWANGLRDLSTAAHGDDGATCLFGVGPAVRATRAYFVNGTRHGASDADDFRLASDSRSNGPEAEPHLVCHSPPLDGFDGDSHAVPFRLSMNADPEGASQSDTHAEFTFYKT